MNKIAKFSLVSKEEFMKTCPKKNNDDLYDHLVLPKRATKGSAGYDFYAPFDFILLPGEEEIIPTGIRVNMQEDYVLMLFPRSGLGFKYRLQLDNTVGIIDSDYYYSDNEGHILIKLCNDSKNDKALRVKAGEAFAQGVFLSYGITIDDDTTEERNGGFGSTNK